MRIIHLIGDINIAESGPTQSVNCIVDGFSKYQKNSFTLELWTFSSSETLPEHIKSFKPRKKLFYFSWSFTKKIWKERKSIDIIHLHGMWLYFHFYILFIAFFSKIKVVLSPRGSFAIEALKQGKNFTKKILLNVIKILLYKVNAFHATSDQEKKDILRIYKNAKIFNVPNCINSNDINFNNKNDFENKFIWIGRLHPIKNLEFLLETFNEKKNLNLEVYGPINSDYSIKLCNHFKSNNIKFMNNLTVKSKNITINKSKFLVMTSFSENFGIVILESLIQGTPVIVSDALPWKDIEDYSAGFTYKANDQLDFISKLELANKMTDSDYLKYSNNAKNYAYEKFSQQSVVKNLKEMYLCLV